MEQVICPDCGAPMVLRETKKFSYGSGAPRKFFGCSRYPECRATHGAHPDGRPLGTPADLETKEARILAHEMFDPLWKTGRMSRSDAYLWLAEKLCISFGDCHIGQFNKEQCEQVILICSGESW